MHDVALNSSGRGRADGEGWSEEINQAGNQDTRLFCSLLSDFIYFTFYQHNWFCHSKYLPTALVAECLTVVFKFHFKHKCKKNQSNLKTENTKPHFNSYTNQATFKLWVNTEQFYPKVCETKE